MKKSVILTMGLVVAAGISSCSDDEPAANNQTSDYMTPGNVQGEEELEPGIVAADLATASDSIVSEISEISDDYPIFPSEYFVDGIEITPLALAVLEPTEGNEISGVVSFIETESGTRVIARLVDISPGEHGFHVHETGDCSAPDASSAGGHFNPLQNRHGGRYDDERHTGDLGNITGTENELATADFYDQHLTLDGANSIIGKAVVIHSGEDDLTTQPSGDAGQRIACGVIELHQTGDAEQG